jgi:hypothetical protein
MSNTRVLVPVMGRERCLGHLLLTQRGWRACDLRDVELGYYQNQADAAAAVVKAAGAALAEA